MQTVCRAYGSGTYITAFFKVFVDPYAIRLLCINAIGTSCHEKQTGVDPHLQRRHRKLTDQCFVVDLLPDELVLTERVAGLSCNGINGSLLHLLLDGTVEHEQRLPGTLLQRGTEEPG